MDFRLSDDELAFGESVRTWIEEHLVGDFAALRGKGGTGQEDIPLELHIEWERELARGGWLGLAFPKEVGGMGATVMEQVVFYREYVAARAPGRFPNMGVTLAGPTIVAYGTDDQIQRFIPSILDGSEMWCQGYSEPDAGSDLANVGTRAVLDGDQWLVTGQKVWTSLAQVADWCFVVARTDPESVRNRGLSYLLVPMDQPGIEIRPIVQVTGGSEFNEVFFDEAVTDATNVVGEVGQGWEVAMGTLAFERGASTLGQQLGFSQEFEELLEFARKTGVWEDPLVRQDLMRSFSELEIMRYNNLRMLTVVDQGGVPGPEMSIGKAYWSEWHRAFGELSAKVRGAITMVGQDPTSPESGMDNYRLDGWQRTFLYSRAHTIYAGSSEVQRNILGERVLGLPREPRA